MVWMERRGEGENKIGASKRTKENDLEQQLKTKNIFIGIVYVFLKLQAFSTWLLTYRSI